MKGIAISTVIGLVIGVIILIVLTPLLFKAASNVLDQLTETIGIIKYSPIERALICYYYLCKGGCKDPEFEDFCSPDKIGRDNYEEICSLPYTLGVEDRQCGSFQFPLKLQLDSNAKISKDRLRKKVDTTHILILTEKTSGGIDWWEVLKNLIPIYSVWTAYRLLTESSVFFWFNSTYLTKIEWETYKILAIEYSNLVKFAEVKSGTYYVNGAKIRDSPPLYFILVENLPRYLNLTSGICYLGLEVMPERIIRITVYDEKTENLKDYTYLMEMTSEIFYEYPSFFIKFWNATNTEEQSYTCTKTDCSESKQFVFNTKKGSIKVELKKAETELDCYSIDGYAACYYTVSKFVLDICRSE